MRPISAIIGNSEVQKMKRNDSFIVELVTFLLENKRWWLFPLILSLILTSFLFFLSTASGVSPMIYAMI